MPKAFPVLHGDGRQIGDVTAQAKHLTKDALDAVDALLRDPETEPRLRFAVAKFALELGWGRTRQMPAPVADNMAVVIDGRYLEILDKAKELRDAEDRDRASHRSGGIYPLPRPERLD